jgi:hypothetical protein
VAVQEGYLASLLETRWEAGEERRLRADPRATYKRLAAVGNLRFDDVRQQRQ